MGEDEEPDDDGADGDDVDDTGGDDPADTDGEETDGTDGEETDDEVDFPSRDLRLVVPYGPGGGFDYYGRNGAEVWEEYLPGDHSIVVENVEGGASAVGVTEVYQQTGDAHEMVINSTASAIIQVGMDVDFDLREMGNVGVLAQLPGNWVASDRLEFDDYDDFVDQATDISWATTGVGASSHLEPIVWAEEVAPDDITADDLHFVHYSGSDEAVTGIEQEEADMFAVGDIAAGANHVEAGSPVYIFMAFGDPDDVPEFAELPQIWSSELDVEGMEIQENVSAFARWVNTPPEVDENELEILQESFQDLVNDEDFLQQAEEDGRPIVGADTADRQSELIETTIDTFSQEPYASLLEEASG